MARGERKFVIEIDQTAGLTAGELTKALSRLAGNLNNGRSQLEGGPILASNHAIIGRYSWVPQPPYDIPVKCKHPDCTDPTSSHISHGDH